MAQQIVKNGITYLVTAELRWVINRWGKLPFIHSKVLMQKYEAVSGEIIWVKIEEEEI